jgi:hypothetical protein
MHKLTVMMTACSTRIVEVEDVCKTKNSDDPLGKGTARFSLLQAPLPD